MKDTFLDLLDAPTGLERGSEIIVDNFAGGGGASTGIEMALGRSPDVAINHDPVALAMHEVNHPQTKHLVNSIYAVDPREATGGRPVGAAWFSPDCKHHSKAKGGKPVEKNIRDLAWVVGHWAELVRPRVIFLENVEEFQDWCPLTADNKPDMTRRGETFKAWVARLRRLGYKVEWKLLRACDYGAPTIRKRLFLIARCDGRPIVWPKPTHGAPESEGVQSGDLKPWRTAAEIIDWSLPCPSIFDTSEEIKKKYGLRAVRPLKDATMKRIARGVMKYVIEAKQPFLVTCNHAGDHFRGQGLSEPMKTITATRDAHGLVMPTLAPFSTQGQHGGSNRPISAPHHTITASPKDQNAVVVPTLVQTGYGEREGQAPRVPGLEKPLGTLVAGGGKHALVSAFLAQHNAGPRMANNAGRAASDPLSTLTTRGTQQQAVAVHLMNMHGSTRRSASIEAPHPTLTAGGQHSAVIGAFLQKYYGSGVSQSAKDPLHTLGTRDTFGLVTVEIDGTTYAITDIGMRMLTPREQFRAQSFPDSYEIERGPDGRTFTKTEQTRMCGNSVPPVMAEALVSANVPELAVVA
jgi:DNA (cytosine-5)-methyltransferase 1